MIFVCYKEVLACIFLSILYVGSLYIWTGPYDRNHPSTIKKRCISVFFMTIISPLFVIFFLHEDIKAKHSFHELMGLKLDGVAAATLCPLLLTMILFLGPIIQNHRTSSLQKSLRVYLQPSYWYSTSQNPIWWRNQIVAPFSEEFTFRACMLPLLAQCLSPSTAIFMAPLFFGIAHLHHAVDRIKNGLPLKTVLLVSSFQFLYTSIFGFYSAFLFIRTGHFLPLFAVHAFCNHMGLPEITDLFNRPLAERNKLLLFHVIGLVGWYYLLFPMTEPSLFSNHIYKL